MGAFVFLRFRPRDIDFWWHVICRRPECELHVCTADHDTSYVAMDEILWRNQVFAIIGNEVLAQCFQNVGFKLDSRDPRN